MSLSAHHNVHPLIQHYIDDLIHTLSLTQFSHPHTQTKKGLADYAQPLRY